MASYKFLVVLVLFATSLSLANSEPFRTKPWEKTEKVNLNDETDAKEPQQYGGGYNSGRYYYDSGRYYPNEETNSVGMSKQRGRGGCRYGCCGSYAYGQCSACCSRTQAAEKAMKQEASP